MTGRACRHVRFVRFLFLFAVVESYAAGVVLLLAGDAHRDRVEFVAPLAGQVQIACCMVAMWLVGRHRGARYPVLWSLIGILGLASIGALAVVLIIRKWVHEARDALRARRAAHGG